MRLWYLFLEVAVITAAQLHQQQAQAPLQYTTPVSSYVYVIESRYLGSPADFDSALCLKLCSLSKSQSLEARTILTHKKSTGRYNKESLSRHAVFFHEVLATFRSPWLMSSTLSMPALPLLLVDIHLSLARRTLTEVSLSTCRTWLAFTSVTWERLSLSALELVGEMSIQLFRGRT